RRLLRDGPRPYPGGGRAAGEGAMIVRVGSASAMKLRAARKAFARFFKSVKVAGVDVPSGVSPQPISFGEVVKGARARARGAFRDGGYSVGIEAGVFKIGSVS